MNIVIECCIWRLSGNGFHLKASSGGGKTWMKVIPSNLIHFIQCSFSRRHAITIHSFWSMDMIAIINNHEIISLYKWPNQTTSPVYDFISNSVIVFIERISTIWRGHLKANHKIAIRWNHSFEWRLCCFSAASLPEWINSVFIGCWPSAEKTEDRRCRRTTVLSRTP